MKSERLSGVGLKTRLGTAFAVLVAVVMVLALAPAPAEATAGAGAEAAVSVAEASYGVEPAATGAVTVTAGADNAPPKEWDRTFDGSGDDWASSVRQTSDGGYVLAGSTNSFGAGGDDFWLVKTDAQGNKEWSRTFGGSSSDLAYSVQQTSDSGYILAGYTWSFGAGSKDFWLVKTDVAGNKEWDRTFGGLVSDRAYSVQQTADGGYILAGGTGSFGAGCCDFWLVKVAPGHE